MKHAFLSPSAAARWLHCSAAPALESWCPEQESDYALEGTMAHAYAAARLLEEIGRTQEAEAHFVEATAVAARFDRNAVAAARQCAARYARWLVSYNDATAANTHVEVSMPMPLPGDNFGTADAVIVTDTLLHVIDFKYGEGVKVPAFSNPQMMLYAAAAARQPWAQGAKHVKMTIFQPRMGNFSTWEMSLRELNDWLSREALPAAQRAQSRDIEPTPGEWCRFCRAKGRCRGLAKEAFATAAMAAAPQTLTADKLAEILPLIPRMKSWCAAVEDAALAAAKSGVEIPGYYVGAARAVRHIERPRQEDAAAALRAAGVAEEDIYKPREIRPFYHLQKVLGLARTSEILAPFISKIPGRPTLIRVNDADVEADFSDIAF